MKRKFIAFSLCAAMSLGGLALVGCTPVENYHTIQATSSNATQGGTVSGYGNYKTNATVKLTATPKKTGGFLAWVKNEEVVSYDQVYTFTASEETEGKYTALFETDRFEFARLSQVDYDLTAFAAPLYNEVTMKNWSLSYNTMSSLYKPLASEGENTLALNGDTFINGIEHEDRVLYADKKYYFSLTINLSYVDLHGKPSSEPLTTNFYIDFADITSQNAVEIGNVVTFDNGDYSLRLTTETGELGKEYTFIATFYDLQKSSLWDNDLLINNVQTLSLTFVYKNPLLVGSFS